MPSQADIPPTIPLIVERWVRAWRSEDRATESMGG
jgi:hypothetical protein